MTPVHFVWLRELERVLLGAGLPRGAEQPNGTRLYPDRDGYGSVVEKGIFSKRWRGTQEPHHRLQVVKSQCSVMQAFHEMVCFIDRQRQHEMHALYKHYIFQFYAPKFYEQGSSNDLEMRR